MNEELISEAVLICSFKDHFRRKRYLYNVNYSSIAIIYFFLFLPFFFFFFSLSNPISRQDTYLVLLVCLVLKSFAEFDYLYLDHQDTC